MRKLTSEGDVVEVRGRSNGLDLSSDVELLGGLPEESNGRVGNVVGAENLLSFEGLVGPVDVVDGQDGEDVVVSGVSEGDARASLEGGSLLGVNVEGDGHGEEGTRGDSEGLDDAAETRNQAPTKIQQTRNLNKAEEETHES